MLKQVSLKMTADEVVGWRRGACDGVEPWQQDAGEADDPTAAVLGGEVDEFLSGGPLKAIGGCAVVEQGP